MRLMELGETEAEDRKSREIGEDSRSEDDDDLYRRKAIHYVTQPGNLQEVGPLGPLLMILSCQMGRSRFRHIEPSTSSAQLERSLALARCQ